MSTPSRRGSALLAERREAVRITLDGEEHAAYLRLSERVLAAWHRGDPLERFIYRG